jgi:type II secretory ATPase GspE/PulE/Tfp pilus assembly ATPase PilB-like protein
MIMHIPDQMVSSLLIKAGKVTQDKINALTEQAKTEKTSLEDIAVSSGATSEIELTKLYAGEIGVPFIELNPKEISVDVLKQIPEHIARLYNMVVFKGDVESKEKQIAMEDPDDLQAIDVIHKLFGQNIKLFIASRFNILSVIDLYRGNISNEISKVITESNQEDDDKAEADVKEEDIAEDSAIAQTVNLLIEYAIKNGASDIHIEPREKYVSIRYRVDGVLRDANKLPKRTLGALVSRVKILSNLKIDERRSPQDGRFKITQLFRLLKVKKSLCVF